MVKLVELYAVPDTYCSGLGSVEQLPGGDVRLTFQVDKRDLDGSRINVVVDNIVMPASNIADAILKLTVATTPAPPRGAIEPVKKRAPVAH